MIKLFILLVEVEIYMKTLRIGNINSCCINGTFVFLGFIGYLVESANDFASTLTCPHFLP